MNERQMQNECWQYFDKSGKFKECMLEVPFLSRCIDIVLVTKDNQIISIECKLKDWKQALRQALDHSLGADKSFILMPERKFPDSFICALRGEGIGLLVYHPGEPILVKEIVDSTVKNKCFNEYIPLTIKRIKEKTA
jgi:hypothetical protein